MCARWLFGEEADGKEGERESRFLRAGQVKVKIGEKEGVKHARVLA